MGTTRITKGRVAVGAVDQDGLSIRSLRIPLRATTVGVVPVSTGKKIPAGSAILDVYVRSATGASAATTGASLLNVGTTAATIGFLTSLNIATAGTKVGSLATVGVTFGALLQEAASGGPVRKPAVIDVETEITYATLAPSPNLRADLIIEYRKLG